MQDLHCNVDRLKVATATILEVGDTIVTLLDYAGAIHDGPSPFF